MAAMLPSILAAVFAVAFVAAGYLFLTIDRTRANSASKDDTQAGLKLVLWALVLAGVGVAAGGTEQLVGYILGGFKGGSGPIRIAMPSIIVGAVVVIGVTQALLSRTNDHAQKQIQRYALGALAIVYGVQAIIALDGVLTGLFASLGWDATAHSLAGLAVDGAVALLAVTRFGAASGWTQPVRPAMPPAQFPPQGGYGGPPQQGGGYPPQGGGYPPQGGGYPPQGGGGYPPQGGGGGYGPR
ncbi:MAG TPA: hypothetical protein VGM88_20950 [Kofleriaceae bacterium]